MNSVADVWQVVLERLRAGGLAETAISTWFDEVEAVAIRDMTFYLCCPNDFKRGTIESLFLPNLKAALKEIFSADFEVKLLSAAERAKFGQEKPKKPTSLLESGEFTFDTFVVGDSNKLAYAAARAVADAPAEHYNPLFIYGGTGLGKTHLMEAIGHYVLEKSPWSSVCYITSETFLNEYVNAIQNDAMAAFRERYRKVDVLLLDDVQFIAGKTQFQEEFFNTFNAIYNTGKQIMMTSDKQPSEIKGLEARLVSRFQSGLTVQITTPSYETRLAFLQLKQKGSMVQLPEEFLAYMARRISSSTSSRSGRSPSDSAARQRLREFFQSKPSSAPPLRSEDH